MRIEVEAFAATAAILVTRGPQRDVMWVSQRTGSALRRGNKGECHRMQEFIVLPEVAITGSRRQAKSTIERLLYK